MAELEWEGRPQRPSLRRAIRHRIRSVDPSIRVIAEGFLGEASTIDLLAVGGEGEIISIRIGRGGDDLALFTQSLADLTWLRPRLEDFLKLAPRLGLEPSAAPRAMLFCPAFAPETLAAAENLPCESIELTTYQCLRQQGQLSVLLETRPTAQRPAGRQQRSDTALTPARLCDQDAASPRPEKPSRPPGGRSNPSSFRTGLTDADLLRVEVEEEKILD